MLNSFAPAFDELSLVRALGTTEPDDTWDLAAEWCASHGKEFVGSEYHNAAGNFDHVDDFAAARNQSFRQASGKWLLWADADDVIDRPELIRDLVKKPDVVMHRFPYLIPQSGKETMRERLIRADLFRSGRDWKWPVHENFVVKEGDYWENQAVPVWEHKPEGPKAGGQKRNLRILTQALAEAPAKYYYVHQEYFYLRDRDLSRRFGKIFLSLPGGDDSMRYQCLLNLAEIAEEKEEASTYALRAHHLFPQHKEALAALVKCSFQEESPTRAMHWAMNLFYSPTVPAYERLWCYEPKWDGWGRDDLLARAYRYRGRESLAVEKETQMRGGQVPKISLIHATRGRVNKAIQCREMWLDLATMPARIEHIFGIDADDKESLRWLKSFNHVVSPDRTCVSAWNLAAKKATGEILIQLSDDWVPYRGWDADLLREVEGHDPNETEFAIAISDGARKGNLMCMAIMSRARYNAQGGEMFSPEYEGVWSDDEFSHRAYRDGIVFDAKHIVFHHMHPAHGKGEMDATYAHQNDVAKYKRGEEAFRRRNPDAP